MVDANGSYDKLFEPHLESRFEIQLRVEVVTTDSSNY